MFLSKTCNCLFLCLFRPLVDCVKRGFPRLVEFLSAVFMHGQTNAAPAVGPTLLKTKQFMVSSSRHWHSKLLCRTIPTRIKKEERRTASSPSTADGFDAAGHPRFEEASTRPRCTSAAIKSAWVFGPDMETKASGRLDVYTQGKPESDC